MNRKMKPVHPGSILREDILNELNLTITAAAEGLGVSRKQLSEVVNENASISAEMAVRLDRGFGVSAEFWLDMQKKYDIWKVENSGRIHNIHRFAAGKAVGIK
ncbi:MAG TPA: HigA family addiction module antitoxin [bacterium]|nr:HigA family addiction module antitoxin [bacterium]